MAQDATGTPTSLGIPKYNTAADAPSGKGFNAAMDAIDALIVAKGLPAGSITNGAVYWNGSAWTHGALPGAALQENAAIPAGFIMLAARDSVPGGWLLCDGQLVSRTTYAGLFSAIGTQYGAGDGSTTFAVPNFKGRVPVGKDTGDSTWDALAETGGHKATEQHTHTATQVAHAHTANIGDPNQAGTSGYYPRNQEAGAPQGSIISSSQPAITVNNYGTGNAGNLQPFLVVNYMVKI